MRVRDECIASLTQQVARLREALEKMRQKAATLRRYKACQAHFDSDKELVALVYDGHIVGPCADPKYEMYEFAEAVEKWLADEMNEMLSVAKDALKDKHEDTNR